MISNDQNMEIRYDPGKKILEQKIVIKPDFKSFIIIYVIIIFILILSIVIAIDEQDLESSVIALSIFLILILISIGIRKYKISIIDGIIYYSHPFGKTIKIGLMQVEKAFIDVGIKSSSDVFRPLVKLWIIPRKDVNIKKFYIHVKVFKKDGIQQLIDYLTKASG